MNLLAQVIQLPLIVPIILYIIGAILMIVELFMPGFGIFGISGAISFIVGIVLRILSGGGFLEIIIVLAVAIILLILGMSLAVKSAKNGRLSKSALILNQDSMPKGQTAGTNDYTFLIGKEGETMTFLRPVGKANFDGQTYEVISANSDIIEKEEKIKVVSVEGQKIIVKHVK
ncbi:MAG: NfeD family protein [Clostridia bacterium]